MKIIRNEKELRTEVPVDLIEAFDSVDEAEWLLRTFVYSLRAAWEERDRCKVNAVDLREMEAELKKVTMERNEYKSQLESLSRILDKSQHEPIFIKALGRMEVDIRQRSSYFGLIEERNRYKKACEEANVALKSSQMLLQINQGYCTQAYEWIGKYADLFEEKTE